MIRAHRIQLDPTAKQRIYFAKACGTARKVWNWALAEWNEQYEMGGKPKANELKRYWNAIKYEKFPWLKEIHRDAHAQPFANLHSAFKQFFTKKGKRPRFKKKGKSRDSFYVANDTFEVNEKRVRLPIIGSVRMTESLRFEGKIQSAVVSREADRWFISIAFELPEPVVNHQTCKPVGIDLGLTTFAALSTGEKIEAPKPLAVSIKRLQRLSRHQSRKVIGSNNRRKAATRLARYHRRVKNIRQDFIHKFTTKIASSHSEVCIEDLNVSGMLKNHKLARAIMDAGWSETARQLTYKCPAFGSTLTVRDRFFASSKICSKCGVKNTLLKLSDRIWTCICGAVHDRDINAGQNLVQGSNTEGYSGIYASGDCSAGSLATVNETAVVEGRTTTERIHVRSHRG
jgi:putative transposase